MVLRVKYGQFHLGRAAYQRVLIIKIHQVGVCINIYIYIYILYIYIIMHVNVYRTNPHMHGAFFTPAGHQEISLATHQFRLAKGSGWFRHLSGILLSSLIMLFSCALVYTLRAHKLHPILPSYLRMMVITIHYYTLLHYFLMAILCWTILPFSVGTAQKWLSKAARLNLALTQQNNKCLDNARQTFQEGTRMAAWEKSLFFGAPPRNGCRIWPGLDLVGLMAQDVCPF